MSPHPPTISPPTGVSPGAPGSGSPAEIARRLRSILAATEYRTLGHRKAALRRVLHEAAAGLSLEELEPFLDQVRARFPDRVFETRHQQQSLEAKRIKAEGEIARLKTERERLLERAGVGNILVMKLYDTVKAASAPPGVHQATGGSLVGPASDPQVLSTFINAVSQIISFAIEQENSAVHIEGVIGKGAPLRASGSTMAELLLRIARGEGRPAEDLAELERRLRRLRLLPGAVMVGAEQSWKGGTQAILEALDPRAAEEDVPARLPGLREAAVLKEVRRRFEQFWDSLDKNLAHYYRGTFEKVYSEKMEGRS